MSSRKSYRDDARPRLGRSKPHQDGAYRRRLTFEGLEARAMPAVGITAFDVAAGTVTFSGGLTGSAANTLALGIAGGLLTHNATVGTYASPTDVDPGPGVAQLEVDEITQINVLTWAVDNFALSNESSLSSLIAVSSSTAPINVPAATSNFISALYQDILGRLPDPVGGRAWGMAIVNGATREQIVETFWNSSEHRGIQVDATYFFYLHRRADPVGRQFYIDALIGGLGEDDLAASFVASAEYRSLHPSDGQFVRSIYRELLGRSADPTGLSTWIVALQTMTRKEVALDFLTSHERSAKEVDAVFIYFLHRHPDSASKTLYTSQLESGALAAADFAMEILGTTEYYNLQQA